MDIIQLLVNGIVTGVVFSLFAISFTTIYATTKIFHFAHGMVFTCGAYFSYLFHVTLGVHIFGSILISVVLTGFVGMLINFVIYEPLQKRRASPLAILVASLGTYIALNAIISLIFTSNVKVMESGIGGILQFGNVFVTNTQIVIICATVGINTLLALFFIKTEVGLSIRALGQNAELAEIFGMSPRRIKYAIFFLASALASVGATFEAMDIGTIEPSIGLEALLICFVALVVGGMENIPGAALGGFVIGMIYHLSIWKVEAKWQQIIVFGVLIAVLILKPSGLFERDRKEP
jgi:branched-chain amino acid transport system permease protein